ncbi:uncharacterized protein LOC129951566 isoform X2 [Eupeodes corollae]|nr:uncharacterized protein LOC129951566 isoform X2 [Eupeodes corollae]
MKIAANWQNGNHIFDGPDVKCDMQQYINNPALNMYKKRERTQNWNHQEKKFLLDLCRKDMRIIENKRLDAGLTAVKNKAWKIIHQKFSNAFGPDRTCNRLKEQWRRMKACTRNEIMDYNNRMTRFGQEVADRKKPSSFTFEIWEFMQESKKACKSETLDGVDYSKMPLALEEDFEYKNENENDNDENDVDNDMEDSRTPPQEHCDVDIKEEEPNENYNDSHHNGDRLSASSPNDQDESIPDQSMRSPQMPHQNLDNGYSHDQMNFTPQFNMNNISATLEALNALRAGQFPPPPSVAASFPTSDGPPPTKRQRTSSESDSNTSPELKVFMDMQSKEHFMRMKILEVQLQSAKYSRDIVEINKTIALQKLQEYASKRLS